ncbi:hypothetical protein QYF61_003780 [Mycteria americana]|uniref:Uncharacterized protein n=1 Tax=Mycteria americana TaxID=33587 RepID=A0AAN7S2H2_MYCAM|nr:hypothetical protein QYF61_003780 [Mycteria americana]
MFNGWRLNHCPGQPVPMLDNPFGEEFFPNIQSKPPLAQFEALSSCPIACYLGEETNTHLTTTSFQVPQPLLTRLVLQTLHQLPCPSLDVLQHLNVSLVVRGPKLNTVFKVQPHQCRVQGHDHFPSPAGHTISDTSQDAIGLLGHLGTLLAHIQLAVDQHPQVLLCWTAFQPLFPKPVALHGVVVTQVQDLALRLVPLQSLPTLKQINTPAQLGVICKLTEGALDALIQIIDKDMKQNWPQHRALGNTTCGRLPTGFNSIHHHSLGPAIQPVFLPSKEYTCPSHEQPASPGECFVISHDDAKSHVGNISLLRQLRWKGVRHLCWSLWLFKDEREWVHYDSNHLSQHPWMQPISDILTAAELLLCRNDDCFCSTEANPGQGGFEGMQEKQSQNKHQEGKRRGEEETEIAMEICQRPCSMPLPAGDMSRTQATEAETGEVKLVLLVLFLGKANWRFQEALRLVSLKSSASCVSNRNTRVMTVLQDSRSCMCAKADHNNPPPPHDPRQQGEIITMKSLSCNTCQGEVQVTVLLGPAHILHPHSPAKQLHTSIRENPQLCAPLEQVCELMVTSDDCHIAAGQPLAPSVAPPALAPAEAQAAVGTSARQPPRGSGQWAQDGASPSGLRARPKAGSRKRLHPDGCHFPCARLLFTASCFLTDTPPGL